MVGLERDTSRGDLGTGGGTNSGVRCAAEEMRLRTFVKRLLDSEEGAELVLVVLLSVESEDPTENRLDSRWLDFFLLANMARTSGLRMRRRRSGE
jgi:hypothetical protein